MTYQHESLASGRWQTLTLAEQMGNIGSEISRASRAKGESKKVEYAIIRALELIDLTLQDSRWRERLKEIARAREVLCDTVFGERQFKSTLEDMNRYFYHFALSARVK